MDRTQFEEPVSVLVGLGYPAKIDSASRAYQLLCELPLTGNSARSVAVRACKLAMEGKLDPETARSAFTAFAKRKAMLAGDDATADQSAKGRP